MGGDGAEGFGQQRFLGVNPTDGETAGEVQPLE